MKTLSLSLLSWLVLSVGNSPTAALAITPTARDIDTGGTAPARVQEAPAAPASPGYALLTVSPPSGIITPGQRITVSVMISTSVPSRNGQFALVYDPKYLQCARSYEGTFYKDWATAHGGDTFIFGFPGCGSVAGRTPNMGVSVFFGATAGGPSGSGLLATVAFTRTAVGGYVTTTMFITNPKVYDDTTLAAGIPLTVTTEAGQFNLFGPAVYIPIAMR
jgi:hypothetical protein